MTLYDTIKERITECMKEGNTFERDTLRTVIGEIQSKTISTGKEATNEMVEKTLTTFKENALECKGYTDHNKDVEAEIAIYEQFIPEYATVEDIINLLSPIKEKLIGAKADGPATGMAIGFLKKTDAKIQGKDVASAVGMIRGA